MSAPVHPYLLLVILGFCCFLSLVLVCAYLYGSDDANASSERREDEKHVHLLDSLSDGTKQRPESMSRCVRLTNLCLGGAECEERTPAMFNQIEVRRGKMRRLESILWVWSAVDAAVGSDEDKKARVARAAAYVLSVMAENKPTTLEAEALFKARRQLYNMRGYPRLWDFYNMAAPFGLKHEPLSEFCCPWAQNVWESANVKKLAKEALLLVPAYAAAEPDAYFTCCVRCGRTHPVTELQGLLCSDCRR